MQRGGFSLSEMVKDACDGAELEFFTAGNRWARTEPKLPVVSVIDLKARGEVENILT
jgi:hypothetical protein